MTYGLSKCENKPCGKPVTLKAWNQRYCSTSCQRVVGIQAYRDGVKKRNSRGGMKCGAFAGSPPQRRVLNLLKKGPQTTLEIQTKATVCNPATWISSLRQNGFNIPDAEYKGKDEKTGIRIFSYRLIKGDK